MLASKVIKGNKIKIRETFLVISQSNQPEYKHLFAQNFMILKPTLEVPSLEQAHRPGNGRFFNRQLNKQPH